MSEWISVKDRPPMAMQGNTVLGFGEGLVFECEYDDGFWCNVYGNVMTHWMMLPPPPKD